MRIDLKDNHGHPRLTIHVDPASPPTVVKATDGRGPAVSLDWDQALDDKRQLRHCPVCGCTDLYHRKKVPQLTIFALIVAAAVIAMIFHGYNLSRPALIVLGLVLAVDVMIYLFAERLIVCYRCQSEFRDTPTPRGVRRWDPTIAERYPLSSAGDAEASDEPDTASVFSETDEPAARP